MIANAAVNLGCGETFKDIDVDLQEETFKINVCSCYLLISLSTSDPSSPLDTSRRKRKERRKQRRKEEEEGN